MNKKLLDAAKNAVELKRSEFTEGYEFIKIERLILKYEGEKMKLCGCDLYTDRKNNERAYLCLITSDNKRYYINTGAKKLVSIVVELVKAMEGDITELNKILSSEPITMKIVTGDNDTGTYYSAEIFDE